MCGYIGNLHQAPGVMDPMEELGIELQLPFFQSYQRRVHPALITANGTGYGTSKAMWWFAMRRDGEGWAPNTDITSFNARNLDSPLWKTAIAARRGLILGTEVGEFNGGNRYLMKSARGLAVGTVYQDWATSSGEAIRSMAVITRPPHPRFSRYHDKSIPQFLPLDPQILRIWLDPSTGADDPVISDLLGRPKIYSPLWVTRVKSFVRGEALNAPEELVADD